MGECQLLGCQGVSNTASQLPAESRAPAQLADKQLVGVHSCVPLILQTQPQPLLRPASILRAVRVGMHLHRLPCNRQPPMGGTASSCSWDSLPKTSPKTADVKDAVLPGLVKNLSMFAQTLYCAHLLLRVLVLQRLQVHVEAGSLPGSFLGSCRQLALLPALLRQQGCLAGHLLLQGRRRHLKAAGASLHA